MVQEEILQCFDENRNPTEGRPRSIVKARPNKYWYGMIAIYVVNNLGQLLCSKRSLNKEHNPGKWDACFLGHVLEHHDFLQTAIKELGEESGIRATPTDLFWIETNKKPEEKVFVERFAFLYNEPTIDLSITDGEVEKVRWIDMDKSWQSHQENPELWSSRCTPSQQELIRNWLATKLK